MNNSINREKTIAHLKKRLIETAINNTGVRALCDSIFADIADNRIEPWINEIPNAEVEPTKRGRWIKMSDINGYYYACSECGEELFREWVFDREFDVFPHLRSIDKTPYCPKCGAKMEGTEE